MAVGRPDEMSDIEWLVALEEIRQLKARRDRYVDARDFDGLMELHAPEHVSHNDGQEPWTSSEELIENLRRIYWHTDFRSVGLHHSYDPEIVFDTPTTARAIWAQSGGGLQKTDDHERWSHTYGYYYESYVKRDGRWLFTTRRWHNYANFGSEGVMFPNDPPKGSDGFDPDTFGRRTPRP